MPNVPTMPAMAVTIVHGTELSDETINFMVKRRIAEYGTNTKDFKRNEQSSIFFFVEDSNAILSFGMLKPLTIQFQEKGYDILGIGSIMAAEKRRGFGRALMEAIGLYLHRSGKTGIGFCDAKSVCGFYRKCGYGVAEDISHRFLHYPADRTGSPGQLGDDRGVIYREADGSSLMTRILGSVDPVIVTVPFW